jgi:hypothetical protein
MVYSEKTVFLACRNDGRRNGFAGLNKVRTGFRRILCISLDVTHNTISAPVGS